MIGCREKFLLHVREIGSRCVKILFFYRKSSEIVSINSSPRDTKVVTWDENLSPVALVSISTSQLMPFLCTTREILLLDGFAWGIGLFVPCFSHRGYNLLQSTTVVRYLRRA